jgi:hypothetical protein
VLFRAFLLVGPKGLYELRDDGRGRRQLRRVALFELLLEGRGSLDDFGSLEAELSVLILQGD